MQITLEMTVETAEELWMLLGTHSKTKPMANLMNQIKEKSKVPVVHYHQSTPSPGRAYMSCGKYLTADDVMARAFDPRDVTCKVCKSTRRWRTAMGKP